MARYIDKDLLLKDIEESVVFTVRSGFISPELKGANKVVDRIMSAPTADVVEVKHGEWLPDYETFVDEWERESEPIQTGWVCSLCGRQEFNREPYCHCGAKMDGGKEE